MDEELDPGDVVFVLDHGGEIRVYPQMVLVWHEIANDTVAGERLSVTYCPLTGSTVAFRGTSPEGKPLDFGTTGRLVNSNLLMYDRQTDSEWPQILGRAVNGAMRSDSLEEIPLYWTTWGLWREHGSPEAPVLSTDTGFLRSYGSDPYGSYTGDDRGYYESPDLMFPVLNESDHLPPKEVVVGIKASKARHAIRRETILEEGVLEAKAGDLPVVAVGDQELDTVAVFERRLGDEVVELRSGRNGALLDGRGSTWRREGLVLRGPGGAELPAASFYEAMWFAWHAFFPETGLAP